MARKKCKKVTKSLVVSAKVTPALLLELDKRAARRGMTRSSYIAFVLRVWM